MPISVTAVSPRRRWRATLAPQPVTSTRCVVQKSIAARPRTPRERSAVARRGRRPQRSRAMAKAIGDGSAASRAARQPAPVAAASASAPISAT
jgi:hypothetical protein